MCGARACLHSVHVAAEDLRPRRQLVRCARNCRSEQAEASKNWSDVAGKRGRRMQLGSNAKLLAATSRAPSHRTCRCGVQRAALRLLCNEGRVARRIVHLSVVRNLHSMGVRDGKEWQVQHAQQSCSAGSSRACPPPAARRMPGSALPHVEAGPVASGEGVSLVRRHHQACRVETHDIARRAGEGVWWQGGVMRQTDCLAAPRHTLLHASAVTQF